MSVTRIRYCGILGCDNFRGTIDSNVKTFILPKMGLLKSKWIKNIELAQGFYRENMKICELHFMRSDLWKTRLVPNAVPSIFHCAGRKTIQTHGNDLSGSTTKYANSANGKTIQPLANDATSKTDFLGTTVDQVVDDDKSIIMNNPASAISCTKCFEELTLRNKLMEVKENFKKKQLALDVLKNELTDLRKLVQKQVDDKSLFCEVCSKAVAEDMLLQHICRQNFAFLPCEYCNEPFSSTEKMLCHLETVHSDESQKYECEKCQKTFYMGQLYHFHQEIVHYKPPEAYKKPQIDDEWTIENIHKP